MKKIESLVSPTGRILQEATKMGAAIGVLLMPKCGLCLAAYLNLFSLFGISLRGYASWVFPVLLGLLTLNLVITFVKARKMNDYTAFLISTAGVGLLVASKVLQLNSAFTYVGLLILTAGSVLQLWQSSKYCSRSFLRF